MDTLWHTMQECKLCYPCLACVCDTRLKVVNRVVQDRQEIGKEEIPYEPKEFMWVQIYYTLQDFVTLYAEATSVTDCWKDC